MPFKDLIKRCRSYRRFYEDCKIEENLLRELVDLARLSASAANLQPLKYMLSCQPTRNDLIFPALFWAGHIKDWPGPKEGERPSAYIIILGDKTIAKTFEYDCGIAAHSILLGAVEKGLGGCMLGAIDKDLLRKNLNIPQQYDILLVIALGKPKEKVVIEESEGDIKYYRNKNNTHHVPKRSLDEIILKI
ncbi:MAG: nitroreductase family protein [Candidatus Omnitrophota bacterium]|nr:MAG: nitroreductase family protein [Candidatus Omnitrophota bacterium]